jgi:hypothetical protein
MRSNRKFPRWVKLELERLENREAPSVTPWTTLSFEGINVNSPAGSPPPLPLNWSQWNSDARRGSSYPIRRHQHKHQSESGAQRLAEHFRDERQHRVERRCIAGLAQRDDAGRRGSQCRRLR